jgi:hypothetical protein
VGYREMPFGKGKGNKPFSTLGLRVGVSGDLLSWSRAIPSYYLGDSYDTLTIAYVFYGHFAVSFRF